MFIPIDILVKYCGLKFTHEELKEIRELQKKHFEAGTNMIKYGNYTQIHAADIYNTLIFA